MGAGGAEAQAAAEAKAVFQSVLHALATHKATEKEVAVGCAAALAAVLVQHPAALDADADASASASVSAGDAGVSGAAGTAAPASSGRSVPEAVTALVADAFLGSPRSGKGCQVKLTAVDGGGQVKYGCWPSFMGPVVSAVVMRRNLQIMEDCRIKLAALRESSVKTVGKKPEEVITVLTKYFHGSMLEQAMM